MTRPTWLFRVFGIGSLPKAMVPILDAEGIRIQEQGLSGSVTFRKFKAPGRRYGYRRSWFIGALVVTELRIAGFAFGKPVINLPLEPARLELIDARLEKDGNVLCVAFDASVFHDDASGHVECRFRTENAGVYLEQIRGRS